MILTEFLKKNYLFISTKKRGKTRFGILNIRKELVKWYNFKENFFIFHFANVRKTSHKFIIHACVMEDLFVEDFIDVNNINNKDKELRGKLRLKEIQIDIYRNFHKNNYKSLY